MEHLQRIRWNLQLHQALYTHGHRLPDNASAYTLPTSKAQIKQYEEERIRKECVP